MDHYLWDIVEATTKPPMPEGDEIAFKAWSKKNALALYLIRESCGSNIFPFIGKINEAKKAWDTLAEKFKPVMVNIGLSQYSTFQMDIQEGNWDAANHFLSSLPEAVSAKISHRGSTALHIAIFAGHTNIVEELVMKMSEEDLKIKDKYGYTVLGCCALVGNIKMAKCIIEKCRILLRIENGDIKLIPVVVALSYNSKGIEMARYLYSETHLEDLMPEKSINGATFITRAIYAKAFDMALDLLERVPSLAIALDFTGMSPMEALARLSFAYPSGNQLIFWKQWIYDSEYHSLFTLPFKCGN
ncbi:hypothetical protein CFP56_028518 [Quercus suber]|uniref:Uncharacterized protein n=2 Tax=Quercus suber TaxID=58331 RepID=A0AAW0JT13_QUESU